MLAYAWLRHKRIRQKPALQRGGHEARHAFGARHGDSLIPWCTERRRRIRPHVADGDAVQAVRVVDGTTEPDPAHTLPPAEMGTFALPGLPPPHRPAPPTDPHKRCRP